MNHDFFDLAEASKQDTRLYPQGETQGYASVCVAEAWVFAQPDEHSARLTQFTYGEPLRLLAQNHDWWLAQSLRDGYSGWLGKTAFRQHSCMMSQATHSTRYAAPITAEPHFKSTPITVLPPDSVFTPDEACDGYLHIADLGWVQDVHVLSAEQMIAPHITAHECLGKTYIWGGRSVAGLDCSALSQLCYRRAGQLIPRDSDLQLLFLREQARRIALDAVQANDLIFLPGHVMIAIDREHVIHASGQQMLVVKERLDVTLARYQEKLADKYWVEAYR
ncbi:C40 family peptidase [Suttonella sp. R2A3]|uniref:NlpC/P60 family protein n=1 Tax=Suttonella sp. R2A3 TaxID=2908648 RepID=UPI001F3FF106|nr:NlpC/P60 family protein [Suttonella sp. R2A3]UJF23904.1 C40 family peptidase [Suttonella sp. R2A3]